MIRKMVNFDGNPMLLDPYDIDFAHRVLTLCGEINDGTATNLNVALRCLARESSEDITMYIQSPGGSVSAGLSILDTMKAVPCKIRTVGSGMVASMGAILLASGDERWIQPNAEVLIHQPLAGISGQTTDMQIHMEHVIDVKKKLASLLAGYTGQTLQKIGEDTERDKILSADAARAYGLIDRIGDPCAEEV